MGSDGDKSKRRRIDVDGLNAERKFGQHDTFTGTMTIQLVGPTESLGVILNTREQAEAIRDIINDVIERAFPRGTN